MISIEKTIDGEWMVKNEETGVIAYIWFFEGGDSSFYCVDIYYSDLDDRDTMKTALSFEIAKENAFLLVQE